MHDLNSKPIELKPFIVGSKVILRPLVPEDAYGDYPNWLNDPEVGKWNSHHTYPYTRQMAVEYIQSVSMRRDMIVLGVVDKSSGMHIGNVSLQNIDSIHKCAEVAVMIGDKSAWGKGMGREAVSLIVAHGFKNINLHRVECGTFEKNIGMQKIALSIGMKLEGTRRKAVFKKGAYLDVLEYGILKEEFDRLTKE